MIVCISSRAGCQVEDCSLCLPEDQEYSRGSAGVVLANRSIEKASPCGVYSRGGFLARVRRAASRSGGMAFGITRRQVGRRGSHGDMRCV